MSAYSPRGVSPTSMVKSGKYEEPDANCIPNKTVESIQEYVQRLNFRHKL